MYRTQDGEQWFQVQTVHAEGIQRMRHTWSYQRAVIQVFMESLRTWTRPWKGGRKREKGSLKAWQWVNIQSACPSVSRVHLERMKMRLKTYVGHRLQNPLLIARRYLEVERQCDVEGGLDLKFGKPWSESQLPLQILDLE